MIYIALLRGVNVGGKAMVSMNELKACFENLDFSDVKTYINSGNVLFRTDRVGVGTLTKEIETCLSEQFGLSIKVLLKTHDQLKALAARIPKDWVNDAETKCDVMFLWPEVDRAEVLEQIPSNPDIETIRYVSGAVLWCINRKFASKTRVTRIIGTPLYAQMSIRNCNTVRKLLALAEAL